MHSAHVLYAAMYMKNGNKTIKETKEIQKGRKKSLKHSSQHEFEINRRFRPHYPIIAIIYGCTFFFFLSIYSLF